MLLLNKSLLKPRDVNPHTSQERGIHSNSNSYPNKVCIVSNYLYVCMYLSESATTICGAMQ